MLKIIVLSIFLSAAHFLHAQQIQSIITKTKEAVGINTSSTNQSEVIAGLKEALSEGVKKGTSKLAIENGFWNNPLYRIIMPPEAKRIEKTLRGIGLGQQVDEAILTMNRSAEDAMKKAAPIFIDAIKSIDIKDAAKILSGSDSSATVYLKGATETSLTKEFTPVIQESLEKTGATRHWATITTSYNKISIQKINTDLTAYVTQKAIQAIFNEIAIQEKEIRKNPAARTSDLLKKVFGSK
jgi:hypothetical protein